MSLEEQIGRLVKAVERNNELLEQNLAGREDLLKAAGKLAPKASAAEGEDKTPSKRKKKAAEEDEAPKAKDKAEKIEMKKKVDIDELLKEYGAWINSTTDKAERLKMKEFIGAVLDELGVGKLAEIEPSDAPKALYWLEKKKAGQKVNFSEELGEDDDNTDDDDDDLFGASKSKKSKRSSEDDDEGDE